MNKGAWFGEQALKDRVMEQLREHQRLDQIVQGQYWKKRRGCHLGCLTHYNNNRIETVDEKVERMFGFPIPIALWLEEIFESLPKEKCAQWVIDSTEAIPVGADLSLAHHKLVEWVLSPEFLPKSELLKQEALDINYVRQMHIRALRGEKIYKEELEKMCDRKTWQDYRLGELGYQASMCFNCPDDIICFLQEITEEITDIKIQWQCDLQELAEKSIEIFQTSPIVGHQSKETTEIVAEKLLAGA